MKNTYSIPGTISDLTRVLVADSIKQFKASNKAERARLIQLVKDKLSEYENAELTYRFKSYEHGAHIFLRLITLYKLV